MIKNFTDSAYTIISSTSFSYNSAINGANKEKIKVKLAAYKKKNRYKNRAKNLADVQLRHARKLQRTPQWYDNKRVKLIYAEARRLKDNGRDVHVDHIVPLQGAFVSGLHVHNNLQILSAEHNMQKGNKYAL